MLVGAAVGSDSASDQQPFASAHPEGAARSLGCTRGDLELAQMVSNQNQMIVILHVLN